MCGKEVPTTRPMMVEGVKLNLCPSCMKFGDDYHPPAEEGGRSFEANDAVIQQRLERRQRRMQTKDIFEGTASVALIEDYGKVIRRAREKKGMDMESFAKSISEKKGTLEKVEAQNLVPNDQLVKKLEKALGIKLTEVVQSGGTVSAKGGQQGLTLGNFVVREEDKKKN
jgi:putative transcription factor